MKNVRKDKLRSQIIKSDFEKNCENDPLIRQLKKLDSTVKAKPVSHMSYKDLKKLEDGAMPQFEANRRTRERSLVRTLYPHTKNR